jgi:hypothetical protein
MDYRFSAKVSTTQHLPYESTTTFKVQTLDGGSNRRPRAGLEATYLQYAIRITSQIVCVFVDLTTCMTVSRVSYALSHPLRSPSAHHVDYRPWLGPVQDILCLCQYRNCFRRHAFLCRFYCCSQLSCALGLLFASPLVEMASLAYGARTPIL